MGRCGLLQTGRTLLYSNCSRHIGLKTVLRTNSIFVNMINREWAIRGVLNKNYCLVGVANDEWEKLLFKY